MEPRHIWCFVLLACACREARPIRYWVVDRAADEVLALDEELCVLERIPVAEPILASTDRHGLWVAARGELVRIDRPDGAVRASDFGLLVALGADTEGQAFVLERQSASGLERPAGDTLLWRVERDHRRTLLGAFPAAGALALQPGRLLVGLASGELAALRPDGAVLALGRVAGPVRALAHGPRAGEWWVLAGADGTSLQLLDRELAPRWSAACPGGAFALAPVEGEQRVWVAGESRVLCVDRGGALELELEVGVGPWSAALATRSGVLLLGPGALLELEVRHGCASVRHTQGGFAALAALARAAQG